MMQPESRHTIQGTIIVEGQPEDVSISRLYIRLLDVSYADAPSKTIECQEISNIQLSHGTSIPFELTLPYGLDSRMRLEVAVHADKQGSGGVSKGDFINMVSVPVTATRSSTEVMVPIRQVPDSG